MNTLKSHILSQENKNRRNFFLMLLLLLVLEYFYQGNELVQNFIERNPFLENIFRSSIFLVTGFLVIALCRFIVLRLYFKRKEHTEVQPNFVLGINRIAFLLNTFIVIISLMLVFGIKPLEFLTSITIVAAAIAILTKEYITGIINGLIIMFSDQIAVGDKIKIGNHTGFVHDITLINLVLKDSMDNIVTISNNQALSLDMVNFSRGKYYQMVFTGELDIKEEKSLDVLEEQVREVLKPHEDKIPSGGFILSVIERKKDSFILRLQFPIPNTNRELETTLSPQIHKILLNQNNEG
ncbi:mechanosensitive ion channel family protein [Algoriphagus namhaensis]